VTRRSARALLARLGAAPTAEPKRAAKCSLCSRGETCFDGCGRVDCPERPAITANVTEQAPMRLAEEC
jgi:hypothetical protein